MPDKILIDRVTRYAKTKTITDSPFKTELEGLSVAFTNAPTPIVPNMYSPIFCMVLQGAKISHFGERSVHFSAGQSLIVSLNIPQSSQITDASPDKPYIALAVDIDMKLMRLLYNETGMNSALPQQEIKPLEAAVTIDTTDQLTDAMKRLFDLVTKPTERQIMEPLIKRELHYRLLTSENSSMLQQLFRDGMPAHRISRAILYIRNHFASPLNVTELASDIGMSTSAFYLHFKQLTSTTPLQYQKDLRLLEARRLLLEGTLSVTHAAFEVGYESPTQFSREYTRKFGTSPSRDKKLYRGGQP